MKIKHFTDNQSYYKVNYDRKTIIHFTGDSIGSVLYSNIDEIEKLTTCSLKVWIRKVNDYYRSGHFEWEYNGEVYETVDVPFSDKRLVVNDDFMAKQLRAYTSLGFHNGQVWYVRIGPDLPSVELHRFNKDGRDIRKYTSVNNVRNFQVKK